MTAGRPPMPVERRRKLSAGDGQRSGGHRDPKPGTDIAIPSARMQAPQNPSQSLPEAPEDLQDRGLAEWDKVWTAGRAWLHPNEDYHWVEQIARAYDEIAEFRAEIKVTGLIVKGYAGQKTANPLIKEIRALEATIRTCLSKLGFSPTDRAKLALGEIAIQGGLRDLQKRTKANSS